MRHRVYVVFALLTAIIGCDKPLTVCGGLGAPDVVVTVVDSLTGSPIAAGATLLTYDLDRNRAPVDSVVGQSDTEEIWGTIDRTGRFAVIVKKAGYRDWTVPEVVVGTGCPTITTARLTAKLVRL
jgi:hypothetical protein